MASIAYLRLESGEVFQGYSFGKKKDVSGEVVFSTAMVGYPESLTDPSFKSQILVLTYPLVGNYGVPEDKTDKLLNEFESDRIHVSALIVSSQSETYSHWNGKKSLNQWLSEQDVPGIFGIDTRELTKIIREKGVVRGMIHYTADTENNFDFISQNLVDLVSTKKPYEINVYANAPKVLVVDCGLKYNQLRCLVKAGANLRVVPWNYNFLEDEFDALFLSNGPGDPTDCQELIENVRKFIEVESALDKPRPLFGICLGHQILSLAIGGRTYKMKYGNRGINIPCQLTGTKRCLITSQNHGYAVDGTILPEGWGELFVNANDGSNEGIYCLDKPFYSVQFHPEAKPGPLDSEFFFKLFINNQMNQLWKILRSDESDLIIQRKKVLILGSGGLSIGQSGEFDYSGSQAIKAYREEGLTTVLINPNIATVQTSPGLADKVYFLPVEPEYVLKVIKVERPDCIALSFGGQTALNCGIQLYLQNVFEKYNIEVLGSPIESLIDTEDRDRFKKRLDAINEEAIESVIANDITEAMKASQKMGYPLLVRAAYALGGLGSGFANNDEEFIELLKKAFSYSNQVIIDKSLWGWKELEYEVVRDRYDNCICVCNMENIDPLGIHTGESMVIAPSQTLDDTDYQMLRTCAIKTIRSLGVVGECNIQFALDPASRKYYIIEVNARLSRSSALASKATGYPLAYVAAKLSLGQSLVDIKNSITRETCACFEPSLDYCVVKVPRWDLRKFPQVSTHLDSSMKSIGEAMAISRSFEEAYQKALRMADDDVLGLQPGIVECNDDALSRPTYRRYLAVASGLYSKQYDLERIHQLSRIDRWFLSKFQNIINIQHQLEKFIEEDEVNIKLIKNAKQLGFSDKEIAHYCHSTELAIRNQRTNSKIHPWVKQIDTVAAEFPCYTNYLYTTYTANDHDVTFDQKTTIVLGSGVYKIGSSVEFDWCCVNAIRELRKLDIHTSVINCNPETVSTDYDEADKLYFDELSFETVMDIYTLEDPSGIILSMGGQIPNNIAMPLYRQYVNVIGTSPETIDVAENRYKFSRLLDNIGVKQPEWKELTSMEEAQEFCHTVGYPCLIRPSYVLSGAAMNVCYSDEDLDEYLKCAVAISKDHPVVISKYITDAKEIEVDAVASNGKVKVISIAEHIENAGVHSGDSTIVLPAQDVNDLTKSRIESAVNKIVKAIEINGPFNMQFMVKDDHVQVIECNLRVSRTYPFVSKTLGVNFVAVAIDAMLGRNKMIIPRKLKPHSVGVKVPKFSFSRLKKADFSLGVEMVSTGEIACYGRNRYDAYLKAIQASDFKLPKKNGGVLISLGTFRFKSEFIPSAKCLLDQGYHLYGTRGTCDFLRENGLAIDEIDEKIFQDLIQKRMIDLVINVSRQSKFSSGAGNSLGYLLRRTAVDNSVPVITDIKWAKLFVQSLKLFDHNNREIWIDTTIDCMTSFNTVRLPGLIDVHVHMREPGDEHKEDWITGTQSALAGGITTVCAMPNTNPAIVRAEDLALVEKLAASKAHCDYALFVGANHENSDMIKDCAERAAALKMYLNNTYGPLLLENTRDWANHIKNWTREDRPICVHAEGQTLSGILHIANLYRRRIHVCHVARREEIELIRLSKENGMNITCEVSPHHLFMSEENLHTLKGCGHVKPPLMTLDDQHALWENMDIIDCFATDHAPHTIQEKEEQEVPGFPGLETALPLLLTAVKEGRLTINDIVEKYHTNPKRIFNLNIQDDEETYIEVDLDREWIIPEQPMYSKCGWTPFAGRKVTGMVRRVVLRGKVVYVDGQILSKPGYGRNLRTDGLVLGTGHHDYMGIDEGSESSLGGVTTPPLEVQSVVKLKDVLSVDQFDRSYLKELFERAENFRMMRRNRKSTLNVLRDRVVGLIFYEPSTRTKCSFSAAAKRLGAQVIEVEASQSSHQKGESFSDFVKCIESYTDCVVVRNGKSGSLGEIAEKCKVPIINAGDGVGEHPTQALLDIYTIRRERGTVNGLTIALVGDLKHGRTVHSLAKLLSLYDVRLKYVSPPGFEMPQEILEYVGLRGVEQSHHEQLDDVLEDVDILYMTRIQKERFEMTKELANVIEGYQIGPKNLRKAKENLVIMHPLPRVDEISTEIDNDPRAAYFRQMKNGMYVRMALLDMLLN